MFFGGPRKEPSYKEPPTRGMSVEELQHRIQVLESSIQVARQNIRMVESSAEIWRQSSMEAKLKAREYENLFFKLVQSLVSAEYAKERLANKKEVDSWDAPTLAQFLQNKVKEKESRIFQEKQELSQLVATLQKTIEELYLEIDEYKNKLANLPANIPSRALETDAVIQKEESDLVEEDVPPFDLTTLDEKNIILIRTIGKTGVYRSTELEKNQEIIQQFSGNSALRRQKIRQLVGFGILDEVVVNVGARGHYYVTFALTKLGKWVYTKLTEEEPVESFRDKLLAAHGSLEHGVLIHDTRLIFEGFGYFVEDSPKANTVEIPETKSFIRFDLTVTKGLKTFRVECERGTHTQSDFNEKMNKWAIVTKSFYFVCPNKEAKEATKSKFFSWVSDQSNPTGFRGCFITLEELKKDPDGGFEVFAY